ncbi:hypothetical protein GCM10022254_49000 [Actinomadura meridiana]|uniref:Uncharacterized protein n=2 Tax=Actinomadura meridiana TaxID=559626 RepID=A0ABP8CBV6_9ACTN
MHAAFEPWYRRLTDMPYLVVVPAFLLWLVTKRRSVGWVAAGILGPIMACEPILLGYDLARWDSSCADLWLGPFARSQITLWVYGLAPVILILAAVYRPGRHAIRLVPATAVLIALMLGAAGDAQPPRTVLASPDDCKDANRFYVTDTKTLASEVKKLSTDQRRVAYICSMRGPSGPPFTWGQGSSENDGPSDGVLLDLGRRECHGTKQRSFHDLARLGVRLPSLQQIAYLCPETAIARLRAQEQERAKSTAEFARQQAKAMAYCKRTAPKGPRPVREATGLMSGGESSSYDIGMGEGDMTVFDRAIQDGLVAAAAQGVTVLTGTEGDICLTVRAYRKAPPLDLKGQCHLVKPLG